MQLPHYQPRRFLPADLDVNDVAALEPVFARLAQELPQAGDAAALGDWLDRYDETHAAINEAGTGAYIAMTCQTDDPVRERAYLHFIEQIEPWLKPRQFALLEQLAKHPAFANLPPHYEVFRRSVRNRVKLYRDANVPRETEEARLAQQYSKICGAMTVFWDGAERPLPEMAPVLEETDRTRRQLAFEAVSARRLQDREALEDIFDRMLALRGEMAKEAGFAGYRDYAFALRERFDYTPADCVAFHEAIAQHVVPLRRERQELRRKSMGLDVLRPWDIDVDPAGRPPMRPFSGAAELSAKSAALFAGLDERVHGDFTMMIERGLLDLDSRPGKAPGGYQQTLAEARLPFIFMNAAGTQQDVETLLHEAGHACHALASREQRPAAYREPPIEFAEVASMGMELLAAPGLEAFYASAPELAERARREHLEGVLHLLPWVAIVDAFQHWLYANPGHSRAERAGKWMELVERFGGIEDWSGCEEARRFFWQRQLHFFEVPFYYIEYGIAQLGALQLWQLARRDRSAALAGYYAGLALGGSRPLPELFAAAGLRFDFSSAMLGSLVEDLRGELGRLDEV
jgi:oligoendopeptidase F